MMERHAAKTVPKGNQLTPERLTEMKVGACERQHAIDKLKEYLMRSPTLVSLDFSTSAGLIVLSVDASTTIGWGAILQQLQDDGTTKPARYENGLWSTPEKKYDAVKLCRGLLKAMKKLWFWLFGRFF
jgi:hypothetical protein